jgi:hypothetical protein
MRMNLGISPCGYADGCGNYPLRTDGCSPEEFSFISDKEWSMVCRLESRLLGRASRYGRALARRPVGSCLAGIRGFPLPARLGVAVAPLPASVTFRVACGSLALRAPAHFTARLGDLSNRSDCRERPYIGNAVLREEAQPSVQPSPAPPLPAKASTLTRPGQGRRICISTPYRMEEEHRLEWPIAK